MRSTTVPRISRLLLCFFLLSNIIGKNAQEASQPNSLTSVGKENDPAKNENTAQELDPFNCKIYSGCNASYGSCQCDSMCNMYKYCCMNAPSRNETTTSIHDIIQYMTCKTWITIHMWVVTECPFESGETCASEGNDFSNFFVTDENNITYNNYRCALCHGVSKYSYWTSVLSHAKESKSQCNTSTNIVCDDADNIPENCINTLLGKGCSVVLYPPKDTFPRLCIKSDELTKNVSCKAEYLPTRHNLYSRKLYRNADCCAKVEGSDECSEDRYDCWRVQQLDYESLGRFVSNLPSYTVFTFDKRCNDVTGCGEVKYFGITFELDLRFKYVTEKPDLLDISAVICLLKRYFDGTDDVLSIHDGRARMWKASTAHSFSLVALDLRLKSKLELRNNEDIQNLKNHLRKMLFSIYVKDKENEFVMENTDEEAKTYNISNLAMQEINIKTKFINAWFSTLHNKVCEAVQDVWDIPLPRCNHLNISVNIDAPQLNTVYSCLSFATPYAPGGVTSGSTGAETSRSTFGRNVVCFLLSAMSVTLITGIN